MSRLFVSLISAAGYGLLFALQYHYRTQRGRMGAWLGGFFAVSAVLGVASAILSAVPEGHWLGYVAMFGWAATQFCLVFLTLEYWGRQPQWSATIVMAGWLLLLAAASLFTQSTPLFGAPVDELLHFPALNVAGILFLVSWVIIGLGLLIFTLYSSTRAPLPLYANRLLYWAIALALALAGQVLFVLHSPVLSGFGVGVQLLGAGGLLYGVTSHRVFDVRGSARVMVGHFLSTILMAGVIIIAILGVNMLAEGDSFESAFPLVLGSAFLLAVLYQLCLPWAEKFIARVASSQGHDSTAIVEIYARTIGHILEIETLATVAMDTINEVLEIRRGGLMLLTKENGVGIVQPVGGRGSVPSTPMLFAWDGPFLSHFVREKQLLLQYDIDVLPKFHSLSQEQRQWLAGLQMAVYVPILADELPIGFLAIGPKVSGLPYRANELKLLQILGGQTVVALTNARLFDDMKKLNAEIQLLNEDMRRSNERLHNMDQVKTDFITIASHELRTPLTQVKGYADILDAMAEDGSLASDDGRRLLSRISRATEQLENVITAMLDVSQIDVDAMSLNLTSIKLDSVLRISLEPLVEVIRQRRLMLTVQGIRDLPPIVGDFQRLVQLAGNLAGNAVKYTPDGGRITIRAQIIEGQDGADQEVELVFADTGVGIDPRDHELVFDKFFRAYDPKLHSTSSTKFMGAGPGLGLSIVRGIVQAHGGRIWVESPGHDPDRCPGSEFHVILPLKASRPVEGLLPS